ncbi:MAG: outer membrane beta-barrel protein [Prevotella sp.]|nr:outer membrane beta-barrel protein [Prevotella sp.]
MKKIVFLIAMTLLWNVSLMAQNAFEVSGTIVDKTTGEAIIGGSIKLLSLPDSAFVTGATTGAQGEFSLTDVKKGTYALKISYVGLATKCVPLDLTEQKKKKVDIGYITMAADAIQLQGVEVTTHVAKVAVSGDSLVYNAAAYRVPEGSTLEALVKQLPGAKVDKEGNITINGKTVSKILVDGKEFFLNDKEVAMKNIPTEMIDRLKTYDRKSDLSRVTGIDDGEEETVLDLTVKKGMKNGWYGNVNLGAGTRHRYAERFNVNRFNDDFQATLLGSANNVADMGFGGGGGRWGGWGMEGLRSSKEIGGNFATAKPKLETGGSVRYRYDGSDNENTSSTEYFNASLAKYSEDYSKNLTSNRRLTGNFRLEWKPDTMTNIIFRPDLTYQQNRGMGHSTSASYSANPNDSIVSRLADILVNGNANRNQNYSTSVNLKGELQANRKLNNRGRNLTLRVVSSLGDGSSKQLSAANITYNNVGTDQQNNRYYETPTKNYGLLGQLTYSEPVADRTYVQLGYTYDYSYSKNDRRAYIYDSDAYQTLQQSLEQKRYDIDAVLHFMEEMNYILNGTDSAANRLSQISEYRNYNQTINLSFRRVRENYNFSIGLDFLPQHTTLNYKYMGKEYPEVTRKVFNIAPRVNLRWNFDKQTNLHVRYNGRTRQPSMTNLLDIEDDSNPLVITKGNPGLKPSFSHTVFANFNSYKAEQQQGIYSWMWFNATRNSIDNKTTYDNQTGVRTTMPMNINGNWNGGGGVGFNTGLGKQKLFNIGIDLGGDYARRVGFYNNDTDDTDTKSVTRSINLNSGLEFSYRKNQLNIMLNGRLDYANSKNNVNDMANMNTYDFSYGAEFEWTAPWGTSLSTDIGMSSRRGYSQSAMNTNELLWNAQVSHSFLRGRALTVMLQVNDILGQQTNISREISALMRTDSRNNAIYQYGMLRVVYRFNILGGKNNLKSKKERDEWDGDWGGFGDWGGGW